MPALYNQGLPWPAAPAVLADVPLPAEDTAVYSLLHTNSSRQATPDTAENMVLATDSFSSSSKADSV